MPVNSEIVKRQVSNLRLLHPELVEDDDAWMLALESETDLDELLTQIVRAIDDAAALEGGTRERLDMLKQRKERFAHRQAALRDLALKIMDTANVRKLILPEATLSIRVGQPQLVGDANPNDLPDDLCKISRELDLTRIKIALKAGQTVPGFSLSNAPPNISIRIK